MVVMKKRYQCSDEHRTPFFCLHFPKIPNTRIPYTFGGLSPHISGHSKHTISFLQRSHHIWFATLSYFAMSSTPENAGAMFNVLLMSALKTGKQLQRMQSCVVEMWHCQAKHMWGICYLQKW